MRTPRSLQGRLLLLLLAVVVVVWAAAAAAMWSDARREIDALLDGHLAQAAALLVAQQAGELEDDEDERRERRIDADALHRYAPTVAFQVFDEGRLVLRSANAPAAPMLKTDARFRTGFATVRIADEEWRVFAAYGGERDIEVYVGEALASRAAILMAVLRSALWPMAVALPLLMFAAWGAVHGGLAPLRRLGSALAARQPRELHPVILPGAPAEIASTADALNELLGRIAALLESERRFTADAAHELRTPIAAIRAQAQVALAETDDASRRHALQKTLEGCDRASHLVDQLLTLSRLEALDAPTVEALDLAALARRVVGELAPAALAKRQSLELEAGEPVMVTGSDVLLAVLVRNLVDNAVRYAPREARIIVGVRCDDGRKVLSVEDSGPGLAEPERGRLGQRFFRQAGTGESGSGLGWSIVRRIATVHGFDVQVERSARLGGLMVRVTA
ncbi:MAG: sensor histidine kinase N-terminal domain-containing protein [Gammaproteobacteria bacterium]|nr:sensor histidine kinase N-terminal domain-containing protein [Gammaproteobacteria bacterium]